MVMPGRQALSTRTEITTMAKQYQANARSALPPTHPGALLREEVLPAAGLSVTAAAAALGVTRQTLHSILSERQSVTPEMALRLGKLLRNGPALWLRMQQDYDLTKAAAASLVGELARIEPVAA